jgi:hypothetical protein
MQSISLGGPDALTRGVNPGIYLGQLVRSGLQPLRFTEPPLRGFVIHLCIYVIVIAGLASLNLTRNPSRPCRWLGHHSCGSRCRPAHEVSTRTGGPLLGQASVRNFGAKPSNTSKTPERHGNRDPDSRLEHRARARNKTPTQTISRRAPAQ